nr:GNAT family N-acetyltransferase [Grimontia indica]
MGYVVSERLQRKGLASEMLQGLVSWCQQSGKVATLSGGAEENNLASVRVLEKNGFVRDGETIKDTVFLTRTF